MYNELRVQCFEPQRVGSSDAACETWQSVMLKRFLEKGSPPGFPEELPLLID